jgi:hypothetical protein
MKLVVAHRAESRAPTLGNRHRSSLLLTTSLGALGVIAARALLRRVLTLKFQRHVRALNACDYRPGLSNYAPDAVLRFNEGPHRWSGEHRGKDAIARFLRNYVATRIQGNIPELHGRIAVAPNAHRAL